MTVTIDSQFRVDDVDVDKALDILKKYEAKYSAKYLIVQEKGKETGKLHLQGWVSHTASDNTYRQAFSRHYKTLGTHDKCFTRIKDFPVYVAYIINNTSKAPVLFSDVKTNYTEDEFNQLQSGNPFVVPKKRHKDYYDNLMQSMEDACVVDGKILYHKLPTEYLKYIPKKLNSRIAYDNIIGIAVRLEHKYPDNARVTNSVLKGIQKLDEDGIFSIPIKSYEP